MTSNFPSPEDASNYERNSPLNDGGFMSAGVVRVADRPIESGLYPWGWVDYNNYDNLKRPHEIQVVLLDDLHSSLTVRSLRKDCDDRKWYSILRRFRFTFGFIFCIILANFVKSDILVILSLACAIMSFIDPLLRNKRMNKLKYQIVGNDDLDNYIRGREFLKALTHKHLHDSSTAGYAAYFNLNAATKDLVDMLKDAESNEYYDHEED